MAAVLFKVEAAVRLGYTSVACTSKPCEWNNYFVKDVEPDVIANINFYTDAAKEKISKENQSLAPNKASCEEQKAFQQALCENKTTAIYLSTFKDYGERFAWKKMCHQSKATQNHGKFFLQKTWKTLHLSLISFNIWHILNSKLQPLRKQLHRSQNVHCGMSNGLEE